MDCNGLDLNETEWVGLDKIRVDLIPVWIKTGHYIDMEGCPKAAFSRAATWGEI